MKKVLIEVELNGDYPNSITIPTLAGKKHAMRIPPEIIKQPIRGERVWFWDSDLKNVVQRGYGRPQLNSIYPHRCVNGEGWKNWSFSKPSPKDKVEIIVNGKAVELSDETVASILKATK